MLWMVVSFTQGRLVAAWHISVFCADKLLLVRRGLGSLDEEGGGKVASWLCGRIDSRLVRVQIRVPVMFLRHDVL